MSKEKINTQKTADKSQSNHKDKHPEQKKLEKKRKHFFKHVEKKLKEKKSPILPPKQAQEFSSNWKTLLTVLNSKQTAESKKDDNAKAQTPQSTAAKDFHKAAHKPDKTRTKTGNTHQRDASTASQSKKPEKPEETGAQQNQKEKMASAPKQHKAKKRKAKDTGGGGGGGVETWIKKKKREITEAETQQTQNVDIWFDDVDPNDIKAALGSEAAEEVRKKSDAANAEKVLVKEHAYEGLTSAVAMDCEMVGVGVGGEESILARVSIVNQFGKCVYDKYVKPTEKVTDYRTPVSGIRPADIKNGENVKTVQKEVAEILKGRILVGHAIHNDLKILFLDHPKKNIRDTQKYKPFRKIANSSRPALRVLCKEVLNVRVHQGEHSSVQDAQAAMRLYTMVKTWWEAEIKASRAQNKSQKNPRKPKIKGEPKSSLMKHHTD